MRALTTLETETVKEILSQAEDHGWEFAGFLESPNGPSLGIHTSRRPDGVDPPEQVVTRARQTGNILVHHNHLSQESLSDVDWMGMVELFSEMFAHCADGTMYWGRAKDKAALGRVLEFRVALELRAINSLVALIRYADANSSYIADFFRKEILNRAMRIRGIVEYEYRWGAGDAVPPGARAAARPAHEWGKRFDSAIDTVAVELAQAL